MGLQSDAIFANIQEKIKENPAKAKSVNGIFVFNITSGGKVVKTWTLDLKSGSATEGKKDGVKIDTTLTVSDGDFVDMALGKINAQQAFMKGKLKIQGNVMLTQKLVPLLKNEAKL